MSHPICDTCSSRHWSARTRGSNRDAAHNDDVQVSGNNPNWAARTRCIYGEGAHLNSLKGLVEEVLRREWPDWAALFGVEITVVTCKPLDRQYIVTEEGLREVTWFEVILWIVFLPLLIAFLANHPYIAVWLLGYIPIFLFVYGRDVPGDEGWLFLWSFGWMLIAFIGAAYTGLRDGAKESLAAGKHWSGFPARWFSSPYAGLPRSWFPEAKDKKNNL